jgi:hypothetical protein
MVRNLAKVFGALAIICGSFFVTLFALDYLDYPPRGPDSIRATQIKSVKAALEQYRLARGAYPALSNVPLNDLSKDLVGGGYLASIPEDPVFGTQAKGRYYYISTGKIYGVLVTLQSASGKIPAGGACIAGVGAAGTGWWGQPPDCPF